MTGSHPFPTESRYDPNAAGGRQLFASITCRKCHRIESQPSKSAGFAVEVFRKRGWLIGGKRSRDVCPGCRNQTERRPDMTAPQRRAAYNAIEARLDQQEGIAPAPSPEPPIVNTVMAEKLAPLAEAMKGRGARRVGLLRGQTLGTGYTKRHNSQRAARTRLRDPEAKEGIHYRIVNEPGGTFGFELITQPQEGLMAEAIPTERLPGVQPAPAAQPPRNPTPPENRRVLDAMDAHYDADRQMYRGSFTDEAVAQQLKVPRAWVTKVRADFYGPETNEAALMRGAKLDDAIKLAEAATKTLLDMAQQAEGLATELKKAREAL